MIPLGLLVTVPEPLPASVTLNTGKAAKFAVTPWVALALLIVTVQEGLLPQLFTDQFTK